ncbi:MAG: hypothetical protein LBD75_00220 [Candidatus Peribacteria bacterium]|nr:hypothetical protein [Candidatus Peribacteria bacterium]
MSLLNPKRDEKRDELVKMYTKLWDTSPQSRDALNNEKFEENNEKNPLNAKK